MHSSLISPNYELLPEPEPDVTCIGIFFPEDRNTPQEDLSPEPGPTTVRR